MGLPLVGLLATGLLLVGCSGGDQAQAGAPASTGPRSDLIAQAAREDALMGQVRPGNYIEPAESEPVDLTHLTDEELAEMGLGRDGPGYEVPAEEYVSEYDRCVPQMYDLLEDRYLAYDTPPDIRPFLVQEIVHGRLTDELVDREAAICNLLSDSEYDDLLNDLAMRLRSAHELPEQQAAVDEAEEAISRGEEPDCDPMSPGFDQGYYFEYCAEE